MNNTSKYDITSAESIASFASMLKGKTLGDLRYMPPEAQNPHNKGMLGSLVEEYFFEYVPGANKLHEPDFKEAGVELKVTGVLPNSRPGEAPYKAKERLVLTMINYMRLVDESWEQSSLMKKCRLMLLLFYLYEARLSPADLRFVMDPLLWRFPAEDLKIIEQDWKIIQQKVIDGKAHELSEGDTFYLGACRKGRGGVKEGLREQPNSSVGAKARAFSLKPSYVNSMINIHWKGTEDNAAALLTNITEAAKGIEVTALEKFKGLEGVAVEDIASRFEVSLSGKPAKSYLADLTMRILGTKKKRLQEFEKADIITRTIRLRRNGNPKEAISFPTFDFITTASQNWEDSPLCKILSEKKFFFVIYQYDNEGILRFKKAMFWNMPYADRLLAKQAWLQTVNAINMGDLSSAPKISDEMIVHVRPHGQNKKDTLPLPNGNEETKRCFWLNQRYLAKEFK